jgi:hypothetical protein
VGGVSDIIYSIDKKSVMKAKVMYCVLGAFVPESLDAKHVEICVVGVSC